MVETIITNIRKFETLSSFISLYLEILTVMQMNITDSSKLLIVFMNSTYSFPESIILLAYDKKY